MSVPDRPTREQVDAALRETDALATYAPDCSHLLAAEVRALRAELERHAAEAHQQAGLASRLRDDLDEARAELAARTPQPAELERLRTAGDALMAAARSLAYAWETSTPDRIMWEEWQKVRPAIEAWMDERRSEPGAVGSTAPLPAVPDGEDVAEALSAAVAQREATPGRPEDGPYPASVSEVADEVVAWIQDMQATAAQGLGGEVVRRLVPVGEDVPARLDTVLLRMCDEAEAVVEDALAATGTREVPVLDVAEVRAAVAAALARPTGGQQ